MGDRRGTAIRTVQSRHDRTGEAGVGRGDSIGDCKSGGRGRQKVSIGRECAGVWVRPRGGASGVREGTKPGH